MYRRKRGISGLVIANAESFEEIADVREGERTESDHFPLESDGRRKTRRRGREERKKGRRKVG